MKKQITLKKMLAAVFLAVLLLVLGYVGLMSRLTYLAINKDKLTQKQNANVEATADPFVTRNLNN